MYYHFAFSSSSTPQHTYPHLTSNHRPFKKCNTYRSGSIYRWEYCEVTEKGSESQEHFRASTKTPRDGRLSALTTGCSLEIELNRVLYAAPIETPKKKSVSGKITIHQWNRSISQTITTLSTPEHSQGSKGLIQLQQETRCHQQPPEHNSEITPRDEIRRKLQKKLCNAILFLIEIATRGVRERGRSQVFKGAAARQERRKAELQAPDEVARYTTSPS